MADETPTGDPLIEQAERAEAERLARDARTANLFDVRRFIGGVFLLYGVVLTVLGLMASDADIVQAAGVNVNLWTGLAMVLVGGIFLAWAVTRPVSAEELAGDGGETEERPAAD